MTQIPMNQAKGRVIREIKEGSCNDLAIFFEDGDYVWLDLDAGHNTVDVKEVVEVHDPADFRYQGFAWRLGYLNIITEAEYQRRTKVAEATRLSRQEQEERKQLEALLRKHGVPKIDT